MNAVSGGATGATISGGGGFQFFQSLELPNRVTGNLGIVGGGGENNSANGFFSFAAGRAAKANHDGTFVWNDFSSLGDSLFSTGKNQFLARAFGHGPGEHSITTIDADGVALAAIQGLYELVKEQQAEIERLRRIVEP